MSKLLIDFWTIFFLKTCLRHPGVPESPHITVVISDVVDLWRKASLAVIGAKSAQKKLKNVIEKFLTERKRVKNLSVPLIKIGLTNFSTCPDAGRDC